VLQQHGWSLKERGRTKNKLATFLSLSSYGRSRPGEGQEEEELGAADVDLFVSGLSRSVETSCNAAVFRLSPAPSAVGYQDTARARALRSRHPRHRSR